MSTRDDWTDVADRISGLAMKLKLHYEEASSGVTADAKAAIAVATDGVEMAFEGLKSAIADPAIKEDVREVATSLRDAVANAFAELSSEVQRATRR